MANPNAQLQAAIAQFVAQPGVTPDQEAQLRAGINQDAQFLQRSNQDAASGQLKGIALPQASPAPNLAGTYELASGVVTLPASSFQPTGTTPNTNLVAMLRVQGMSLRHGGRRHGLLATLVLLVACMLGGCHTVKPDNRVVDRLQKWSLLDPPSRLLSASEMPQERAGMVRWLEQYLRGEYRVIDQRFVLTRPGFTNWALLGSKAGQYMQQELGAMYLRQEWKEEDLDEVDAYRVLYWKLDQGTPRYFSLAMTSEPLPGPEERKLMGYFELIPSAK